MAKRVRLTTYNIWTVCVCVCDATRCFVCACDLPPLPQWHMKDIGLVMKLMLLMMMSVVRRWWSQERTGEWTNDEKTTRQREKNVKGNASRTRGRKREARRRRKKRQTQTEAGFFGFLWGEAKWGNPRIEKSSFSCVGDKDFLIPAHLNLSSSLFLSLSFFLFSSLLLCSLLNASLSWKDSLVHSWTHTVQLLLHPERGGRRRRRNKRENKVNACTHLPRLTWWVLDCVFTLMSTVLW